MGAANPQSCRTLRLSHRRKGAVLHPLHRGSTHTHDCAVSFSSWFVQNLAHKKEEALAKAEEIGTELEAMGHYDELEMTFHEEPRPIYTRYVAFGDIEMKMSKSRKVWWGNTNEEFWDAWRADKAAVKAAGYWVKRNEDGKWLLFRRVEADEIEWRHE